MDEILKYRRIIRVFITILFFAFFFYLNPGGNAPTLCDYATSAKYASFDTSIITNKYIDKPNHNIKTIELGSRYFTHFFAEKNAVYDSLAIGDTIFKNENELFIGRIKSGKIDTLFFDFGCDKYIKKPKMKDLSL